VTILTLYFAKEHLKVYVVSPRDLTELTMLRLVIIYLNSGILQVKFVCWIMQ
jgi:hypothetical protein